MSAPSGMAEGRRRTTGMIRPAAFVPCNGTILSRQGRNRGPVSFQTAGWRQAAG